jgi:hypothetical protein
LRRFMLIFPQLVIINQPWSGSWSTVLYCIWRQRTEYMHRFERGARFELYNVDEQHMIANYLKVAVTPHKFLNCCVPCSKFSNYTSTLYYSLLFTLMSNFQNASVRTSLLKLWNIFFLFTLLPTLFQILFCFFPYPIFSIPV